MKLSQYLSSLSLGLLAAPAVFAADAPVGPMGPSGLTNGLMLAALAVVLYFIAIRPQAKRAKEHQQLVTGLQTGDEIITVGGLLGKITRITDSFFVVMIANGVEVPVQRQAIVSSVPKGTLKSI